MSETPEQIAGNATDRPLVTFALFAYNQEKYIREAVEGAFAQTYEPLEIILSDDCSSDRTFEIMQEMAAAYEGPHEVRVRQSPENRGTLQHVLEVASEARGELFVVAAGDDVSLPERTKKLVPYFCVPEILAGSSDDYVIDESGNILTVDEGRIGRRDYWHSAESTWLHGAAAAYRIDFLRALPMSTEKLLYEDMIFSDLIRSVGGRTFRASDSLIMYRYHAQNLSSRHEKSIDEAEAAAMLRWRRAAQAKEYCVSAMANLPIIGSGANQISNELRAQQEFFFLIGRWPMLGLPDRARLLRMALVQNRLKAAAIRVFGYSFFKLIRRLQWREFSR